MAPDSAGRSASFPAFAGPTTRLLILGSLPGATSLAKVQYYAHPQNQFWRLVGAVIDTDLSAMPYAARLAALARAGIGLWDVIRSATRVGSLDSAIRDPMANDLAALVASLPALRAIAFNGAQAHRLGHKLIDGMPSIALPSSSPAHAAKSFEAKRTAWLALRDFI